MTDAIQDHSAVGLAAAVAASEVSPVEVVDAYIARIEELDGHYRSVVTDMFDQARSAAAAAADRVAAGDELGPLHGVPFGIKDLYDTAGVVTAAGSRIRAGHVPELTATAVQRLTDAGAIPLAKLAMTEFAGISHHPDVPMPRNPHDASRSPGGSSSGSGVAVSAQLCPFALGSDTVASIRNPAAWNGCVGFKPTYGRVSRAGVFPLGYSYDHCGPLTRSVTDAALVTQAMAGQDPLDPTTLRSPVPDLVGATVHVDGLRVGFDEAFVTGLAVPGLVACVREAFDRFEAAGAQVVPVTVPLREESVGPYETILQAEVADAHHTTYPARADDYTRDFAGLLEGAQRVDTDALVHANLFRMAFCEAVDELFREVDVLVTPVGPINAPPLDAGVRIEWGPEALQFLQFTYLWNLAGAPALALPWGLDGEGLPNSVQIIGPTGEDGRVLAAARFLERAFAAP